MNEIILIRGLPGSGKTTKAKTEYPEHRLVEADMYFVDEAGVYHFDSTRLKEAHEWCQKTAEKWLKCGLNVVVCNTFTRVWEMQPYFDMGFPFQILTADGNYENVHGVPEEIVEKMRKRFEPYSPSEQAQ